MHLEIVPEPIDGAIVCNVIKKKSAGFEGPDQGAELAIALHNWVKENGIPYLIIDLQDEKSVCTSFLAEILQLRRRLRVPLLFAGVLDGPRKVLESYDYQSQFPAFIAPEDAVKAMRLHYPGITEQTPGKIPFGEPIFVPRQAMGEEAEAMAE